MSNYSNDPSKGFSMSTGFRYKKIWVVESLKDGDLRTGKELFEDTLVFEKIDIPDLDIEFVEISNRTQLFDLLREFEVDLQNNGSIPLLHIESHGSANGLSLKSGEYVLFQDLLPPFRQINLLSRNNFFVVVAACKGQHMVEMISQTLLEPAPFFGICGPYKEIRACDVLAGYKAFYTALFRTKKIDQAVSAFKQAAPKQADSFTAWNAEYLFMLAFRHYIDTQCNGEILEKRIARILKEKQVPVGKRDEFEKHLRRCLETEAGQRKAFDQMKKRFFLHRHYPDDQSLPDPNYDHLSKIRPLT